MRFGDVPWVRAALIQGQKAAGWAWDANNLPDANTILKYPLNDNAANTNVTDDANAYTGTASSNTSNIYNAGGQFGGCFFGNETYYVDNATAALIAAVSAAQRANCTIGIWLKSNVADWSTKGTAYIWRMSPAAGGDNIFTLIYRDATDKFELQYCWNGGSVTVNVAAPTVIDTTTWHAIHATVSIASDTVTLYADGVELAHLHGLTAIDAAACTTVQIMSGAAVHADKWHGYCDLFTIDNKVRF